MFKVNNRNTRKKCEICSKLTIKTPERRRSGVFIVNFEHILHHFLVFLLFEFEQVVARESCATENYRQIFAASVKGQLLKASNIK